ncbi:hypothetical protein EDD22DRAFT_968242 [Suillus occidentalis]|nr:hypothetical protein EDD22DRAFT_968242 [Suillus occidentalis]
MSSFLLLLRERRQAKHSNKLLLDRLSKDSAQPQRKDDWLRVAAIEDLPLRDAATRQTATQQLESAARENYLLTRQDLDHTKNLVLDFLGWGVSSEYLVEAGSSAGVFIQGLN